MGIFEKILSFLKRTALAPMVEQYCCHLYPEKFAMIGKHTQIGSPVTLKPENIEMDDHTRIQNGVNMIASGGRLIVKKFSAISSEVVIVPGGHTPTVGLPQFLSITHINDKERTIIVEEDCWIAARAMLLSTAHIGRGAVIGANTVISKRIPPYAVVSGNPATIVAVRFSLEQVIEHEKILYPEKERLPYDYLKRLYDTKYAGLKAIGTCHISNEDIQALSVAREKYGIIDYSKE